MVRKRFMQSGFDVFYEYSFRAKMTVAFSWSFFGDKLGWLTSDNETSFLHIWDRIAETYDAIELPEAVSFSFKAEERNALFLDRSGIVHQIDLTSLTIGDLFDSKIRRPNLITVSPNGKYLAVTSESAHIRIFDMDWNIVYEKKLERGDRNRIGPNEVCLSMCWNSNSDKIATAGFSATVIDVTTAAEAKYISDAGLYDVAWSPDGKWLAGASSAKTVVIWNGEGGAIYRILEGHKAEVRSISFSADGKLLASQSSDGMIIVWDCSDWSSLKVRSANARARLPGRRVAFHPRFDWLAHTEKGPARSESATVVLSKIDVDEFRRNVSIPAITYASAKIVLVGESGAGKTGLGWRIANDSFKEHPSTHGQQFWLVDQLSLERADGTQCEAVLWDLAGQPDYRLIHALFLDDVDVALVVYDPTKSEDPLYGVEYWLKQLAHRRNDGKAVSPPVVLVAARIDRGVPRLTNVEMESFCKARGITKYLGTSAATGEGIPELLEFVRKSIPWDEKPATVTTKTFKTIKDHVLRLKESPSVDRRIVSLEELRRHLKSHGVSVDFSKEEFLSAVGHLATHGYVAILRSSKGESRILLLPELLNNLAASIVLEARRNPRGLGALDERQLLEADNTFNELKDLTPAEREILLNSTVLMLLQNNVCYRETDPLNSRSYLVFPELINLKMPQLDDSAEVVDDVSYSVTGAIGNVYASLVVLLGYTDRFTRTHQWRDHARYEFGNGMVCGFRLESGTEAELNFVLYFGTQVKDAAKGLFVSLFENFLAGRDVTVQRYMPVFCSKGHMINRSVIKEQFSLGLTYSHCPRCGERVGLPEQNQTIQLTSEESEAVEFEERAARQRSMMEKAIYSLKSYASQLSIKPPNCFISYAWGDPLHERWVERFANDLINAGIVVILDRWDNEKIGSSVPRFVERAMHADRVILIGTPMYRRKYQNDDPMSPFVLAAEGDIIGSRLLGTEDEKTTIMPILLDGSAKLSFPDLLHGRVYGDFRDAEDYANQTVKLLMNLYEIKSREKIFGEILKIFED